MIAFHYQETEFVLNRKREVKHWVKQIIAAEGYKSGAINFIFCSDEYLLKLNLKYLKHKTLTDIITFNYNEGKNMSGDIFISIDRVSENAAGFKVAMEIELRRVMAHGILHLAGYNDHTETETAIMRKKEDQYIGL